MLLSGQILETDNDQKEDKKIEADSSYDILDRFKNEMDRDKIFIIKTV